MHGEESFLHIFFILIRILFILIPLLDEKTYDKKKSHEPNMIQKNIIYFECNTVFIFLNVEIYYLL